ncbi:transmembrane reductase CYB561D2 [Neosynchiropus ocellatus]
MSQIGDPDPEPRFYSLTRRASPIIAHVVCVAFTVFIAVLSRPGTSWFSWHPLLMSLAFSLFMTEAVLLFSPRGSLFQWSTHKTKGRVHWLLQVICVSCAVLGLMAIYYNKHLIGKPHFTSGHGRLGLLTVLAVLVQSLAAMPLIYTSLAKGWSLARLKRYHAASGLVSYLLGCVSLLLGLCSAWFTASVSSFTWYLAALCPALCAVAIMSQVTRAYVAKKRLQS